MMLKPPRGKPGVVLFTKFYTLLQESFFYNKDLCYNTYIEKIVNKFSVENQKAFSEGDK